MTRRVLGVSPKKCFDSLALLRYIHLNPMRAKTIKSLEELDDCGWNGNKLMKTQYFRRWL